MDVRGIAKNVSIAFGAQGVAMLVSLAMSLLVPKVLGVTEFGYWQLFLFYGGYVGFFHFGLNDGVYLLNGGKTRQEIDGASITSQFLVGLFFQFVIALGIGLAAFFCEEGSRRFVWVAVALYLLLANASSYLGYVFQSLNETRLFSYSSMLDRLAFLVPLIVLIAIHCDDFGPYVVLFLASRAVCLLFCLVKARDILRSGLLRPSAAVQDCLESIRVGVKLMLANIASMLILGVMRFAIDARWGIDSFGEISFALSMVNFFLTFISQVAMVLFPALRRASDNEQASFFRGLDDALSLLLPIVYGFCYPIILVLSLWLPQYTGTMHYFVFLLPICVFDSKMNLLGTTYFKVLRMEKTLLCVNVATVVASGAGVLVGVFLLESVEVTLAAAVVAIVGRSLASEVIVARRLGGAISPMSFVEVGLTVAFVTLTFCFGSPVACAVYWFLYACYLFAYRQKVRHYALRLRSRQI